MRENRWRRSEVDQEAPAGHIGILAQVKADEDSIEALVQPVETADSLFQEIQRLIGTQLKVPFFFVLGFFVFLIPWVSFILSILAGLFFFFLCGSLRLLFFFNFRSSSSADLLVLQLLDKLSGDDPSDASTISDLSFSDIQTLKIRSNFDMDAFHIAAKHGHLGMLISYMDAFQIRSELHDPR
ncbi:hypothetical protein SO802_021655 [Lithocarpus litseifolius]|uniref:Uncharacterized protein n=1 Tax=Lithocarpus litseifolius TaxID=425828 RepID=A0AAW2CFF0_9ROSI